MDAPPDPPRTSPTRRKRPHPARTARQWSAALSVAAFLGTGGILGLQSHLQSASSSVAESSESSSATSGSTSAASGTSSSSSATTATAPSSSSPSTSGWSSSSRAVTSTRGS